MWKKPCKLLAIFFLQARLLHTGSLGCLRFSLWNYQPRRPGNSHLNIFHPETGLIRIKTPKTLTSHPPSSTNPVAQVDALDFTRFSGG